MDMLFRYRVKWHDANGAGEPESGIQYEGFCRQKALSEKHLAEDSSCSASITVLVPGPKGWYSPAEKKAKELEDKLYNEAAEEYFNHKVAEHWGTCYYDDSKKCDLAYMCGLCPIKNK